MTAKYWYSDFSVKAVADGAASFYLDHYVTARVSKVAYGVKSYMVYNASNQEHYKRREKLVYEKFGDVLVPDGFVTMVKKVRSRFLLSRSTNWKIIPRERACPKRRNTDTDCITTLRRVGLCRFAIQFMHTVVLESLPVGSMKSQIPVSVAELHCASVPTDGPIRPLEIAVYCRSDYSQSTGFWNKQCGGEWEATSAILLSRSTFLRRSRNKSADSVDREREPSLFSFPFPPYKSLFSVFRETRKSMSFHYTLIFWV